MKSYLYLYIGLLCFQAALGQKTPKITLEKVAEKCKDLPFEKKVMVKVARFDISNSKAQGKFGDELATMLTSAIQETSCFRVLEMKRNKTDLTDEWIENSDGSTDGTGAQSGKMLAAQLIATGEITEFAEGSQSTSAFGLKLGADKAKVGFILKLLDPQTGEILFSKSINHEGGGGAGFKGLKIFGIDVAGSTMNVAMADACEKAIIYAVEAMVNAKDKIRIPEPLKPQEVKKFNASNCTMLRTGSPKVMILIKEGQTMGANSTRETENRTREQLDRQERQENRSLIRDALVVLSKSNGKTQQQPANAGNNNAEIKKVIIEQSATETEMIRTFVEAGFRVVDPKAYDKLRKSADSLDEDAKIAATGLKLGANIILTGVAITEKVNQQNGMISCRARIEIRAITTDDATILASNTISAGGMDISETVATKIALRNASDKMSAYILEQLCSRNITFATPNGGSNTTSGKVGGASTNASATTMTTIAASNVNFIKLKALSDALRKSPKVKDVKSTLKEGAGSLTIEHTGSADDLVDFMSKLTAPKFEITGMEGSQVTITMQ